MTIEHIYCCECGHETQVESSRLSLGQVVQCPACLEVRAHVYPRQGGRAWIKVSPEDVEFYDLLTSQRDRR